MARIVNSSTLGRLFVGLVFAVPCLDSCSRKSRSGRRSAWRSVWSTRRRKPSRRRSARSARHGRTRKRRSGSRTPRKGKPSRTTSRSSRKFACSVSYMCLCVCFVPLCQALGFWFELIHVGLLQLVDGVSIGGCSPRRVGILSRLALLYGFGEV